MRPGEPSRTMVQTAMLRAAHQVLDRPLVFADPIAVGLVPEASEQAILAAEPDFRSPSMLLRRASMVLRSRFVEDRLAAAAQRGVRQYVIVAAGLDTFPWRQPDFAGDMRIFFADLPASLAWVKDRLRERGLSQPRNLTFVPVDLEELQLGEQLFPFGWDRHAPMFCSALGIVQYLTPQAVEALLGFAASAPRGSEIAFSFSPPDDELDGLDLSELRQSIARGQRFGEPWLSHMRPRELITRLGRLGFSDVIHLTVELAQERYFGGRHDGLKATPSGQVIAAVV